ncbi:transcription termination factor Rho [Nakamurella antarctica]|uniref:transcription termination factor Rho n=1 Tax=Nakamurella antarctica TaxID=1902245 RepID=UPI001EEFEB9E|nr:transcription termination factor Rho [Nakamurella antarctica]
MSETTEQLESPNAKRGSGLSSMVLPELKSLAGQLGLKGTSGMKKADLVAAISARQSAGSSSASRQGASDTAPAARGRLSATSAADLRQPETNQTPSTRQQAAHDEAPRSEAPRSEAPRSEAPRSEAPRSEAPRSETRRGSATRAAGPAAQPEQPILFPSAAAASAPDAGSTARVDTGSSSSAPADDRATSGMSEEVPSSRDRTNRRNRRNRRDRTDSYGDSPEGTNASSSHPAGAHSETPHGAGSHSGVGGGASEVADNLGALETVLDNAVGTISGTSNQNTRTNRENQSRDGQGGQSRDGQNRNNPRNNQNRDNQSRDNQSRSTANRDSQNSSSQGDDDDLDENGRRRGRRFRDRDRNRRGRERFTEGPTDVEIREDDVLLPVSGILDVSDSYAFVRTSGYLTGSNDVYVSLSQVRKGGLRRGDHVTGAVRAPRDGEAARQKFNALVRLDTVNGLDPELAKDRPEFTKLTPLYPNERLRLETESNILTTRVIDLVMPVGKGQRALIVSPPKAGKTSVLQAIANAIATNNPECHLMVVLVDERPEEVTDMQRSVRGEVIASTFDRPPSDHTQLAELAIERAKRLVEMGRDVVVLLDSITRLGRAYNLAAPASGRILSGGVDSTALFPPKRFLGAARNIENGGSLTIFASALVETGSAGDTVIFEEFKGTGNAELKLDRRLADKRMFPAIDIDQSSTRKEDLLLAPEELVIVHKLRRVLAALDAQQSLDLVLGQLRKTRSNIEFLMQVAQTTPGSNTD